MKNYQLDSRFILRTPTLPITFLNQLEQLSTIEEQIRELKKIAESSLIREAIFLASPILHAELIKFCEGALNNKEEKQFIISFVKYLYRMSSRCTPFGLFAGCTMGKWDNEKTNIIMKNVGNHIKNTRLDMDFLCNLSQILSEDSVIKKYLLFYPNTSLYKIGDKIRFVDYFYQKKRRVHQIVGIKSSEYIDKVINFTNNGKRIEFIVEYIIDDEISFDDGLEFVDNLINERVLISELDGSTTGLELLDRIALIFNRIEKEYSIKLEKKDIIELLQAKINEIDIKSVGEVTLYYNIINYIKMLSMNFDETKLFQTDIIKPALANTLNSKIAGTIRKGLDVLNKLTPLNGETPLAKFKEKFYEKYENREISLLEALDTETGIGYNQPHSNNNPILEDTFFNTNFNNQRTIKWDYIQDLLHKKLIYTLENNFTEMELKDADLEGLTSNWEDTSDTLALLFRVVSTDKNQPYPLIYLPAISGGATKLLGRFTNINMQIDHWVKDIADCEQKIKSNYLLAEIVHLPEARTGNILQRTNIRKYEIPYLGTSTVEIDNHIKLQDLFLSLKNGEMMLRSKSRDKFIIPNLGNAHNYAINQSPLYHFLCDLQFQSIRENLYFNWGSLSSNFHFLPRVRYHNIILSRATWQLTEQHINELIKDKTDKVFEKIQVWRMKLKLPQKVVLTQGDRELLINFNSSISCNVFLNEIKNLKKIILTEFIFDENDSIVKDESGEVYSNEFLAVFSKQENKETLIQSSISEFKDDSNIQRSFLPGSEWLYFKIYVGTATADIILVEYLYPTVKILLEDGIIKNWFYIRYSDPETHLRVRFKVSDLSQNGNIINAVYECLKTQFSQGLIPKIQIDSYNREIERYSAHNIEDSELLFYYDSTTTIEFLLVNQLQNDKSRWLYALASIDILLDCFNLSQLIKTDILKELRNDFNKEFNINIKAVNEKYCLHKEEIRSLFNKNDSKEEYLLLMQAMTYKKEMLSKVSSKIQLNFVNKSEELIEIIKSYIHMLCNRIFISGQRKHETIVYNFLYNYYMNSQSTSIKEVTNINLHVD